VGAVTSQVATLSYILDDCDEDGLPDEWELEHNLDANDPGNRDLDPDEDGMTNREEYLAGTDPQDNQSALKVELVNGGASGAVLRFMAMPEVGYTIQYRTNLTSGLWLNLTNIAAQAVVSPMEISDAGAITSESRFYRLVTPQQE